MVTRRAKMDHTDLFAQPRPPYYGGNKIPDSYLNRMSLRGPVDDFGDMPMQMQRFIGSICGDEPQVEDDDDGSI